MKKSILSILLLLATIASSAQSKINNKDYYMQKSKNQKTVAWFMAGTGATAVTYGILIYSNGRKENNFNSLLNSLNPAGPALALVGAATMLGSIPLFIASSQNKKKMASLTTTNQLVPLFQKNNIVFQAIPSLTLKLSL